MTNVRRIYVEKRKEYATEAHEIQTNLVEQLGLTIHSLRIVHRYDVQGISEELPIGYFFSYSLLVIF